MQMKSLNTKLALAAVGIAMLATPALAQGRHHQLVRQEQQQMQDPSYSDVSYPNPVGRTGSEEQRDSGAAFDQ
jgi:hypothetical protein